MIYTCPMHPQIEQNHPGNCPICGMTLELKSPVSGSEQDNAELRQPSRVNGAAIAPRPSGSAELVSDDFPVFHWRHDARIS
jgi:Heavy metal binding domain